MSFKRSYFESAYRILFLAIAAALVVCTALYFGFRGARAIEQHVGPSLAHLIHGRACALHLGNGQLPRQPVEFSDIAENAVARVKVDVDCLDPEWRASRLSFHVYSESGRLLRWDNPQAALHRGKHGTYGVIQVSLAALAALGRATLKIKPDLINSSGAWASKRFFTTGSGVVLRFDQKKIAQHLNKAAATTGATGNTCALYFPQSTPTSLSYDYKRLARQKVFHLHVATQCHRLAGRRLGYHVLTSDGRLVAWNAALAARSTQAGTDATADNAAVFAPSADANGGDRKTFQATLSLPMQNYIGAASATLRFVPDVINTHGSLWLRGKLATSALNVNYDLVRFRHIYQIVPFLMPDKSIGFVPVIYDLYSPHAGATGFHASEAFFEQPSHQRYDTWRHELPHLAQGDNWNFTWLSYITPAPGTYSVQAGFVYDPSLWYSAAFKVSGGTFHALRIRWFLLCAIAGLVLFTAFLQQAWQACVWSEKTLFALAAGILVYPIIIPVMLSVLGWALIATFAFIYLVSHYDVARSGAAMTISGALFGLSMELYWGTLLQTHWYGIMLSAAAQALALALVCLVVRRPSWRLAVVAGWFLIWLCLYAGVDIYLNFFGEAPRLSVFSYAGQGAAVSDEILDLIGLQQILGIFLGGVYVVGLIASPWLSRLSFYVKSVADRAPAAG